MQIPILLAHGALGWWDELIFLGIVVIFVGMMAVSWFQSRDMNFTENDLMPHPSDANSDSATGERFELE